MRKNSELIYSYSENIMILTSKLEQENKELFEIIKISIWWERLKNFLSPEYVHKARVSGTQIVFKKIENLEKEIQRINFYIYQFNQLYDFKFPKVCINEILGVKMQIKKEKKKE